MAYPQELFCLDASHDNRTNDKKVWEDHWLQHLKDVALAIQCTCIMDWKDMTVKSNTSPNHDTGCRTSMEIHNATIYQLPTTVSVNSNTTIMMLQAEEGFDSKDNALPSCCRCLPFLAPLVTQTHVVFS
ncbi:hypothetical protein TNCV_3929101 [Trichonephila clavipes]|nr:hypothetical protein TNCV_3929101 [Trichonephila clavipes]